MSGEESKLRGMGEQEKSERIGEGTTRRSAMEEERAN